MRKDMSFSGKVKQELLKQLPAARHCQIAELAALFDLCLLYTSDAADD